MKMTNDFPLLLSNFLLNELPIIRNQSNNTISSYRDTYIQTAELYDICKECKKATTLKVSDFDSGHNHRVSKLA